MNNTIKGLVQVILILLQFYVGLVLLLTPEKAHIGHYLVVFLISIPIVVGAVREKYK